MPPPATRSPGRDRLVCCAVAAGYVGAFAVTYPLLGPGVCALTVVPVAAAGWYCGSQAGLLAALAGLLVNTALAGVAGAGRWSWGPFLATAGGPTLVVCAAAGVACGRAREVCERLREQLALLRKAEEALRESEERYRCLVEEAADALFVLGPGGRIVDANRRAWTSLGYTREELLALSVADIESDARAAVDRPRGPGDTTTMEGRHRRKDGTSFPVEVRVGAFVAGGRAFRLALARDTTERVRAQSALRAQEELLRNIISHIPCGVFWKDRESVLLGCNEQFARNHGFVSPGDLIGKTDFELPFSREQAEFFRACDRRVMTEGKPLVNVEEEQTRPGGERAVMLTSKVPLRDERGGVVGVLGVYQDITDRKTLEKGLRQAQKMEAVGQLAGGIAHDFNNILTIILASLDLVHLSENDPSAGLLDEVRRAAERAADLTAKLLGYARKKPLRVGAVRPAEATEEVAALLRRTLDRCITVEVAVPPGVPAVRADAGELHQVLLNLCLNARDAMPAGGTLRIEAAPAEGGRVRLSVVDTGAGITPEVRERIFEPFFTTKPVGQGTGLGLAMVHGIVTQHGGRVEVDSQPGRGTRFDLYLPEARPGCGTSAQGARPRTAPEIGVGETLLLVEDEEPVRRLARTVLEQDGYKVLEATDGHAALAVYGSTHVDLVVLDLTMPGLNGVDALQRLAVSDPSARVLLCSGHSSAQVEALACPQVVGFLPKPYLPDDLLRAVRDALADVPEPAGV